MALHLKGKIAVRSRYPIDSIATLQKVYTPGVAEVCMKIAKDPKLAQRILPPVTWWQSSPTGRRCLVWAISDLWLGCRSWKAKPC